MLNPKLPKIWYGGDYNPDQWPKPVWDEDMRLFKLAGIDVATLPVFSWSLLQPSEEQYDFAWLDEILAKMAQNGVYACMATSTGAYPAWMAHRYPDVTRVDFEGRKRKYGKRHNPCPSSPTYRHYSVKLAEKLAERYKDHPTLVAWHISNEYGGYCYCDNCAKTFRVWLRKRYGTLDNLNERWNSRFWGHTYYSWDEIPTPSALTEGFGADGEKSAFQPLSIDYNRFQSDALLECYRLEYEAIKRITPHVKITTNMMGTFKPLNYFEWAKYMDMVSWDSYPSNRADWADIAMRHALMRGLKGGDPWMLMEQTPSQVNWMSHCGLKRPGMMRLQSYQAVAQGADTVMFFQLRQSRGAAEKFHGAVISHAGHEHTRVFREVAELGKELQQLGDTVVDSRVDAKVAMLFDWENWWALEYSHGPTTDWKYVPQVEKYYRALWHQNIPADFISWEMDMSKYAVVIAPSAYMLHPGYAKRVEEYVAAGGTFITTFMSGMVDETDRVALGGYPGELRRVTGVWNEEFDGLFPDQKNRLVVKEGALAGSYEVGLIAAVLNAETANVVGTYGTDFYAGTPALTCNQFGKGTAWYVASDPEQTFVDRFLREVCAGKGVRPVLVAPANVEVIQRKKGERTFTFVLNHNGSAVEVDLSPVSGRDLLSGREMAGKVEFPAYGVAVLA